MDNWTASNDIPVEENQSHLQLQLVIKNRCSILALRYKNAHHFDNYWFDITDWHFDITDLNHIKTQVSDISWVHIQQKLVLWKIVSTSSK